MGDPSVTHLWIEGTPEAGTLRGWITAGTPAACEGDLVAYRLGRYTLLASIDVDAPNAMVTGRDVVAQTASAVEAGVGTTLVDLQPGSSSWVVDDEVDVRDAAQLAAATARLRALVPIAHTLEQYLNWAERLENAAEGRPVPGLPGVAVERVALGLPPPRPVAPAAPSLATGDAPIRLPWVWLGLALAAGGAFLAWVL